MFAGVQELVSVAGREASTLGHDWLGSEHFLLALLSPDFEDSPAGQALQACTVDYGEAVDMVVHEYRRQGGSCTEGEPRGMLMNPDAHNVTAFAAGLAAGFGATGVRPDDLLVAILWDPDSASVSVLEQLGASRQAVLAAMRELGAQVPQAELHIRPQLVWGETVRLPLDEAEGVLAELPRLLPFDATFSFNHDWEEMWFQATEGIDLPAYLAFARGAWQRRRLGCPCCGYVALDLDAKERICPVCGWIDDGVQSTNLYSPRGPNSVTLAEARSNFERGRAAYEGAKTRAPLPDERPPWRAETTA